LAADEKDTNGNAVASVNKEAASSTQNFRKLIDPVTADLLGEFVALWMGRAL